MSELIRYDVADGIGTITIDRPEKRNAMTFAMLAEFIETVRKAGADDDARVVIVTGTGGAFCAGTDLADLNTVPGETRPVRGEAEESDVWWPLASCPKPVIAAVDGPAVGMGAEFTSQCDVRIASTRARFAWNFVHRGLVPDTGAGTWLLPRIIGLPAALRLLYSGEFLQADEALELGYVARGRRARRTAGRGHRGGPALPRRVPVLAATDQGPRLQRPRARPGRSHAQPRRGAARRASDPRTTKRASRRSSSAERPALQAAEARHTGSMRCATCGQDNRDAARFCDGCGTRLGGEPPAHEPPRVFVRPPSHLVEKILNTRSSLEGERKQVTVMFADVKGSMDLAEDFDPEEWRSILERFFEILTEGVHRFEGTVNQFLGDGIMALFGAPIAHEDHGHRACYASLYLTETLGLYARELRRERGLSFSVRIGLNSGEVVVGAVGDDMHMEYTAVGHTVGLAARMEQLAEPGTVYVAADTAALVKGFFRLEDLGTFGIKGVREPVRVHQLIGVGEHQRALRRRARARVVALRRTPRGGLCARRVARGGRSRAWTGRRHRR